MSAFATFARRSTSDSMHRAHTFKLYELFMCADHEYVRHVVLSRDGLSDVQGLIAFLRTLRRLSDVRARRQRHHFDDVAVVDSPWLEILIEPRYFTNSANASECLVATQRLQKHAHSDSVSALCRIVTTRRSSMCAHE